MGTLVGHAQTPIKRVLVEEFTGTWCASCAYGSVYFEHVESNYPNAIPIAIHNGYQQDPMEVLAYEIYMSEYYGGSPTFLFDRKDFAQNSQTDASISASNTWANGLDTLDYYMDELYNDSPLATIGITQTYDATSRLITATITASFIENTTGEIRLNCFIVEDNVTGDSSYDQANSNFSGWTGGPSYLQSLIDQPALITGYSHGHVLRSFLGNPEGVSASIPNTISSGSSYSKTFTYTLPDGFDENEISLVGVAQRYGANKVVDREIVNANSQHLILDGTSSIDNSVDDFMNLSVYPNPTSSNFTMEFYVQNAGDLSCSIYNLQGELIKELFNDYFTQGEYRLDMTNSELPNGIYMLRFVQDGQSLLKKIVIN